MLIAPSQFFSDGSFHDAHEASDCWDSIGNPGLSPFQGNSCPTWGQRAGSTCETRAADPI